MNDRARLVIVRQAALVEETPAGPHDSLAQLRLAPGVIPALLRLREAGYRLALDGEPPEFLLRLFASQGVVFGSAAGPTELVVPAPGEDATSWSAIADRLAAPPRTASVRRKTRETDIRVDVNLDREAPVEIATGIGFFDHMLEQIARHGGFALVLECRGDLEVDEHHTVEDCALALGQALREALGDKLGLQRYGFLLPMDESLATVAIDLSGRPCAVFEGRFGREAVGGLPTELVPHFFRSLADSLGAALHVQVRGENTHHMVEACFKGVGRALRQALKREGRELPSSKGVL